LPEASASAHRGSLAFWYLDHKLMASSQATSRLAGVLATITHARRLWQVLFCALTATVLYLALSPSPPAQVDLGWDKLNHATAFAALTISGCFAFPGSRKVVLLVLLGVVALGGLIEILQAYVPGRDSDWFDLVADSVGMLFGAFIALPLLWLTRAHAPRAA
jgi:VanZ family protein